MRFHSPQYLHLLWLLIALVFLLRFWLERRASDLQLFLGELGREQVQRDRRRGWRSASLTIAACFFLILALARPQWGEVQQPQRGHGVDIIFALDTSLSMLAEDIYPSRLERAKRDLVEMLDRLAGHRFGLIAFAESSAILAPLTIDAAAVRLLVEELSPEVVDEQGTWLARAIRRAVTDLAGQSGAARVLVLFSDGEDQHSDAANAAQEALDAGMIILAIGLGSAEGANIYLSDSFGRREVKRDSQGQAVITRLNERLLAQVAEATGGRYWRAQPDSSEILQATDFINALDKGQWRASITVERRDRYQIPLAMAVILLSANFVLSLKRK